MRGLYKNWDPDHNYTLTCSYIFGKLQYQTNPPPCSGWASRRALCTWIKLSKYKCIKTIKKTPIRGVQLFFLSWSLSCASSQVSLSLQWSRNIAAWHKLAMIAKRAKLAYYLLCTGNKLCKIVNTKSTDLEINNENEPSPENAPVFI